MADYKDIVGSKVTAVSSNPEQSTDGQVWYNTTDNVLRYKKPVTVAAWASGGNLNFARSRGSHLGTQTAALYVGGLKVTNPGGTDKVESYNGTAFTEVADIPAGKLDLAAAGTQPAGLAFGGDPETADTQTWNGSGWTEVNNLNKARHNHMGDGTQTAALCFGGEGTPHATLAQTESWNGTSWTEVNDLNTAREYGAGCGTNTAALCFGGGLAPNLPAGSQNNENWNGTSWTEVGDLTVASAYHSGGGTSTLAITMGRFNPSSPIWPQTEAWNGTSWTEVADLSTGRYFTGGGGTQGASLLISGQAGPGSQNIQSSEEFSAVATVAVD